jgi:TetR/AcrR family transcriptional regulator, regulator of cefoperazone and chloramphenicol sensitivity
MASPYEIDRPLEDLSTRARIRDAAMVEFGDKGFKGATMKSIAAAAGVSVGLVQHHFGTKEGLRAACDERVLDMVRFKIEAVEAGTISDPRVLSSLMAMGPHVQRYVGRALVEDSPGIRQMVDDVMSMGEHFLTAHWTERFPPGSQKARDAAAVMTAINTSTMVMQDHLARRIGVEPFSEEALTRIGVATFEVWEAFADFTESDVWRELKAAINAHPREGKENNDV